MKVTTSGGMKSRPRVLATGCGIVALACGLSVLSWAGDAGGARAKTSSGAGLYTMHCSRCHPERYPTERTDAKWKTVMLHMRTRAKLPAKDARAVLEYLQESN